MNIEELKRDYPETFKKLHQEGVKKGVLAERQRLKELDEIKTPENAVHIENAKYSAISTAEQIASAIVIAQIANKKRGF